MKKESLWLSNPIIEAFGIILPGIVSSVLVLILNTFDSIPNSVSSLNWLILVVFIDVSHVWSTLFRTYLNRKGQKKYNKALWLIPIICYFFGVTLYASHKLFFWRTLAYLAVFHFIRQQFGFFSLYAKKEGESSTRLDRITIYSASIIPLTIWHLNGPQNFNWFIPFDFFYLNDFFDFQLITLILKLLGPLFLFLFLIKEFKRYGVRLFVRPKVAIVITTYLSWWTGIVWVPKDWSFTVTNIVTHGVPYFTLIGLLHFKTKKEKSDLLWPKRFSLMFALLLVMFIALAEEAFWDVLMWRDHPRYFSYLYNVKKVNNISLQALIVPLLALPQATHYALDGLIWRRESS